MAIVIEAVGSYIRKHARPLERATYAAHFENAPASGVIAALLDFQNDDGGFGHGLEPDFVDAHSSALATTVAFQCFSDIEVSPGEPMVQRALAYLAASFLPERSGWAIVEPSVDDYPHAPWWGYEGAMAGFGWGNPSAEILGYLLRFGSASHSEIVGSVSGHSWVRIMELGAANEVDFHELLCFCRLYDQADETMRARLHEPLERLIRSAVETDPKQWGGYGATPLTFVRRPDSPWVNLFEKATIDANLDLLAESIIGDHWEPNWDWDGAYPDDWQQARLAWSGKITIDNLILLQEFGRI